MDRLIRGAEAEIPPASQSVCAGCYVFAWGSQIRRLVLQADLVLTGQVRKGERVRC